MTPQDHYDRAMLCLEDAHDAQEIGELSADLLTEAQVNATLGLLAMLLDPLAIRQAQTLL